MRKKFERESFEKKFENNMKKKLLLPKRKKFGVKKFLQIFCIKN